MIIADSSQRIEKPDEVEIRLHTRDPYIFSPRDERYRLSVQEANIDDENYVPNAFERWRDNRYIVEVNPAFPNLFYAEGFGENEITDMGGKISHGIGKHSHDYVQALNIRDVGRYTSMAAAMRHRLGQFATDPASKRFHEFLESKGFNFDEDNDIRAIQIGIPGHPNAVAGVYNGIFEANPGFALRAYITKKGLEQEGIYGETEDVIFNTMLHELAHLHGVTYEKYGRVGAEKLVEALIVEYAKKELDRTGEPRYRAVIKESAKRFHNAEKIYGSEKKNAYHAYLKAEKEADSLGLTGDEALEYIVSEVERRDDAKPKDTGHASTIDDVVDGEVVESEQSGSATDGE